MTGLPEPLTPAECDLQAFPFMPLHVARLRDSDLAAEEDPEICWYALLLWCASWHQIPAASLPDNDVVLTKLVGLGRDAKTWQRIKAGALRSCVKCSDGRLYHPVVAEQALEAWGGRVSYQSERSAAAERQARWREDQRKMCTRLRELGITPPEKAGKSTLIGLLEKNDPRYVPEHYGVTRDEPRNADVQNAVTHSVTPPVTPPVTPVTPKKGTGTGTGTGTGITPLPPSPPAPPAPNPRVARIMHAGGFITPPTDLPLVSAWIEAGADFDKDIIPTLERVRDEVRGRNGRAPFRLKLFDSEIRTLLAEREAEEKRWREGADRIRQQDQRQAAEQAEEETPAQAEERKRLYREALGERQAEAPG
jgi:hypothetical protein